MKWYVYILIMIPAFVWGQNSPNVVLSSKVVLKNDSLNVGDVAELQYTVTSLRPPSDITISLADFDTLENKALQINDVGSKGDFEIVNYGNWEVIKNQLTPESLKWENLNGAWYLINDVKVQCWMSGVYIMPPLSIATADTTIVVDYMPTPLQVEIPDQLTTAQDSTQTIAPIKDIIREGRTVEDFYWLIFGMIALSLLLLAFVLYRKYGNKTDQEAAEPEQPTLPAHIIAQQALQQLKSEELWQQNKIKEYQSRLTYVIREYLENRYGIKALESTTDEIKRALKKQDFDMKYEAKLSDILQMADLIKFAKAKPPADIHDRFMDDALDFVNNTKEKSFSEE